MSRYKNITCARCGAVTKGYIENGKAIVLRENGNEVNSWVYGCDNCDV